MLFLLLQHAAVDGHIRPSLLLIYVVVVTDSVAQYAISEKIVQWKYMCTFKVVVAGISQQKLKL